MKTSNSFLIYLVALLAFQSLGQTKMIAFKSHSGSSSNFKKAIHSNLFTIGESNFGMAPQRHVRNSSLDTVKLLSPHVAVMVTSESCHWEEFDGRDPSSTSLWSAGTDTVYDHPVFNSKNSIAEIKTKLKREYFFANPIDSVVFIGFDGKYATVAAKKEEIKEDEPISKTDYKDSKDKKRPSYFMIIILSLLSTIFRTPF